MEELHYVLLTGVHVTFLPGDPHTWDYAQLDFLIEDPAEWVGASIRTMPEAEFEDYVTLTDGSGQNNLLDHRYLALYRGAANWARGRSMTRLPSDIEAENPEERLEFYRQKADRERLRRFWPAIQMLLEED